MLKYSTNYLQILVQVIGTLITNQPTAFFTVFKKSIFILKFRKILYKQLFTHVVKGNNYKKNVCTYIL